MCSLYRTEGKKKIKARVNKVHPWLDHLCENADDGEQCCGGNKASILTVRQKKRRLKCTDLPSAGLKWRETQTTCFPPGSTSRMGTLAILAQRTEEGSYRKAPGLVLPRPRTRDSVISMLSERIIGTMCLNREAGDGMPTIWGDAEEHWQLDSWPNSLTFQQPVGKDDEYVPFWGQTRM